MTSTTTNETNSPNLFPLHEYAGAPSIFLRKEWLVLLSDLMTFFIYSRYGLRLLRFLDFADLYQLVYSRLWADLRNNGRLLPHRLHQILLLGIPSRAIHPFLVVFCGHSLCLLVFRCHCLYLYLFLFRNVQRIVAIIATIHNIRPAIPNPILLHLQSSKVLLSPLTLLFLCCGCLVWSSVSCKRVGNVTDGWQ